MADKITETDVVQIQAQDSDGNKYSFNVENPKTSTTIENVRETFQPLINSGKWLSKQGFPFSYIPQATVTKTKKIQLDDSGTAITITPTTTQFTNTQTPITFTIDGAPITGYKTTKTATDANLISINTVTIDQNTNTLTVYINSRGQHSAGYFTVTAVTTAGTISGQINFNAS